MRKNPKIVGAGPGGVLEAAAGLMGNPPVAKRVSDTEWFVSLTSTQLQHAVDLNWDQEDVGLTVVGGRPCGLQGTREALLKAAEFYEQDGENDGISAVERRVPREAARRIRIAFGLDPDVVAREVRERFYASIRKQLDRGEDDEDIEPNGGSDMPKVDASFHRHFDEVERVFPDIGTIELHVDEAAGGDNGHGSERQFGYCKNATPVIIAFAPKTETMPQAYIDGLMAHEFGHAIDFRYDTSKLERRFGKKLPESIERRADKIAEYTFGRRIEYGDRDIQCIGCGGKPTRPKRLG